MQGSILFFPAAAQVALTLVLLYLTGRVRIASVRKGETRVRDIALGQTAWPALPTQFANSYNSQFQLPVLFYVALVFADLNNLADMAVLALAWGFVITRCAHALVHVSTNNVARRFYAFTAGFALLAGLWIYMTVRLFMIGN